MKNDGPTVAVTVTVVKHHFSNTLIVSCTAASLQLSVILGEDCWLVMWHTVLTGSWLVMWHNVLTGTWQTKGKSPPCYCRQTRTLDLTTLQNATIVVRLLYDCYTILVRCYDLAILSRGTQGAVLRNICSEGKPCWLETSTEQFRK